MDNLLIAVSCLACLGGCGESAPVAHEPAGGFNYSKVSYEPRGLPHATKYSMPETVLDAAQKPAMRVEAPITVKKREALAFEGKTTSAKEGPASGLAFLEIYRDVADRRRRVFGSAIQGCQSMDREMKYRLELKAPTEKGKFAFEIRFWNPAVHTVPTSIVSGTMQVD